MVSQACYLVAFLGGQALERPRERGVLLASPDEDPYDGGWIPGGVEVNEVHFERVRRAVHGVLARGELYRVCRRANYLRGLAHGTTDKVLP